MNRLHKITKLSLVQKMYLLLFCFVLYGWYKNAFVPYFNHYTNFSQLILILLYPLCGLGIGALFDLLFKTTHFYTNKFYGLLFSLILPISTNICYFLFFLSLLLFINTILISRKNLEFNFLVFGKLLFVLFLFLQHNYGYANGLEESHMFIYSYLDGIFGHNVSAIFTSNVFFILLSFGVLFFDSYYKKEIPFYSYGFYIITLVFYAFLKSDMNFILNNLFSSTILFVIVFLAPLSCFSPYTKKRTFIYCILFGGTILPFSLLINFYEGVYIALALSNSVVVLLNAIQKQMVKKRLKE